MENQLHPRPGRSNYYVLSRRTTEGEMQLKEKGIDYEAKLTNISTDRAR